MPPQKAPHSAPGIIKETNNEDESPSIGCPDKTQMRMSIVIENRVPIMKPIRMLNPLHISLLCCGTKKQIGSKINVHAKRVTSTATIAERYNKSCGSSSAEGLDIVYSYARIKTQHNAERASEETTRCIIKLILCVTTLLFFTATTYGNGTALLYSWPCRSV